MGLRVLVVGSGGREHALAWAMARSPLLEKLFCAPGNAGTASVAQNVGLRAEDVPGLRELALRERIDLTVVGPEAPLVAGLADDFRAHGLIVFGPGTAGARIEGSKTFAKEIVNAAGVPTGAAAEFTMFRSAMAFVEEQGTPLVVKADGLAAGKGVFVAMNRSEAEEALRACLVERRFGDAGSTVLLEEYLEGEEASLLALVSDGHVLPLAPAQDYKRALDGDRGPNTGGMGSYSPVPAVDAQTADFIVEHMIRPTVAEMERRGIAYCGVLYAGVILTAAVPKCSSSTAGLETPKHRCSYLGCGTISWNCSGRWRAVNRCPRKWFGNPGRAWASSWLPPATRPGVPRGMSSRGWNRPNGKRESKCFTPALPIATRLWLLTEGGCWWSRLWVLISHRRGNGLTPE